MLVGHLHAGAVHIGAQDPDRQVIVFIDGDDLDGVQGVVGELVVRPAPGHRGVHARGDIGGDVAVGIPLRDLQVGPQAGQVQRGGSLADAAADLVHRLPLDIGGSRLIAPGGGPLAHHVIVGEHVAAVHHILVDGCGGQLHIGPAGGGAAHMGAGLAQHVPEQHLLQLLRRDGGQLHLGGDGDGLAGRGRVQQPLGLVHIEVRSGLLRYDGARLLVIGGVLHHAGAIVVDLLGGEGLGGKDPSVVHKHAGRRAIAAASPSFLCSPRKICGGHGQSVQGFCDFDGILRHLVGGVLGLPGELLTELFHFYLEDILLRLQHDAQLSICSDQAGKILPALDKKAAPALHGIKCGLGTDLIVQFLCDAQLPIGAYGVGVCAVQHISLRRGFPIPGLIGQR